MNLLNVGCPARCRPVSRTPAVRILSVLALLAASAFISGCSASSVMLLPQAAAKEKGIYPPIKPTVTKEETVTVTNSGGYQLHGWLSYNEGARGVVLVSPGNAESREAARWYTSFLRGQGFRVLVFSFQGFDENGGSGDLHSLVGDAHAFYSLAKERFPGEPIVYFANSISTAAALCMAANGAPLDGLVLEGAFDPKTIPFSKVAQSWVTLVLFPISLPVAISVSATVPSSLELSRCLSADIDVPALFVHNRDDIITPYRTARRIYEDYPGRKEFYDAQRSQSDGHLSMLHDATARKKVLESVAKWLHRPAS
jgi:pimeloyl-ACP methyl ester carboxylesterase